MQKEPKAAQLHTDAGTEPERIPGFLLQRSGVRVFAPAQTPASDEECRDLSRFSPARGKMENEPTAKETGVSNDFTGGYETTMHCI